MSLLIQQEKRQVYNRHQALLPGLQYRRAYNLDMHHNLKEITAEEKEVGDSVMMCKACSCETREYHR